MSDTEKQNGRPFAWAVSGLELFAFFLAAFGVLLLPFGGRPRVRVAAAPASRRPSTEVVQLKGLEPVVEAVGEQEPEPGE